MLAGLQARTAAPARAWPRWIAGLAAGSTLLLAACVSLAPKASRVTPALSRDCSRIVSNRAESSGINLSTKVLATSSILSDCSREMGPAAQQPRSAPSPRFYAGLSHMAVIPAKQARLRRARASRDLVNAALANGVKRSDELVSTGKAGVY